MAHRVHTDVTVFSGESTDDGLDRYVGHTRTLGK